LLGGILYPPGGICWEKAACDPIEVIGLFPLTGGAFSPARLDLAAASDLELILLLFYNLFLNNLRIKYFILFI
jgi:hypothetical protein